MADFTGNSIADTYKRVLQIGVDNTGVSATLQDVEDGAGATTALQLSTKAVVFQNGGTAEEYARFNDNGKLLMNNPVALTTGQGFSSSLQLNGLNGSDASLSIARSSDNTGGTFLSGNKSRGTLAAPTIVVDGDNIFNITAAVHNGTDFDNPAVQMRFVVEGTVTPGASSQPGMLEITNGSVTSARFHGDSYFEVLLGIVNAVFTNGSRPSASSVRAGTEIWNSDDKFSNTSDGSDWYDPAGNIT
ncbi:MAG: hypothetical protein JKY52_00275 [Flavobacteriales bacterium]|nr:hypothetical protein [Flavobacteriales bacterium]